MTDTESPQRLFCTAADLTVRLDKLKGRLSALNREINTYEAENLVAAAEHEATVAESWLASLARLPDTPHVQRAYESLQALYLVRVQTEGVLYGLEAVVHSLEQELQA